MTLTTEGTGSYATPTCGAETIRRNELYSMPGTIALRLTGFFLIVTCVAPRSEPETQVAITPGSRVLMDAHNCYPYGGQWDRPHRARAQDRYTAGDRAGSVLVHRSSYTPIAVTCHSRKTDPR